MLIPNTSFKLPRPPVPMVTKLVAMTIMPGQYAGLLCRGSRLFKVTMPVNTLLTARIDFQNSAGDLDLHVFDDHGQQLASSTGTGNTEQVRFSSGPADTRFLEVAGYNGAENTFTLTLSVGVTSAQF